jgi:23S rRNA (guanosine2251-2'-O)-methyltransferase
VKKIQPKRSPANKARSTEQAGRGNSKPRPSPQKDRDGSRPPSERKTAKPKLIQSEHDGGKPQRVQPEREAPKGRRSHQTGREGLFINNWSALEEYLRAQPASLNKIFHAPRETKRLREMLDKYGTTVICEEDKVMETGVAANISLAFKSEEQLLSEAANRSEDLIIACDHVTDTRNLGAIARTAAFFGISTLLMPKDRQAPITSATLGTAQGAFATVSPTEVTNLGRTLVALKDRGYWIAAADMAGTSVDKMPTRYEKLVLVLGSEDKGVAAQILHKSDFALSIPSFGGKLESLNVSVAAGILIHALRAQSAQGKILPEG